MAPSASPLLIPRPPPALLSLVIPVFNEQEVIPHLRAAVTTFLAALTCPAEVVVVDDGSRDQSLAALCEWAAADPRVKVVALARNFGHQAAATAGLDAATGEAVVLLDADLQDPPAVIRDLLVKYTEGYDLVHAQRRSRAGESAFKRLSAWVFYRLLRLLGCPDLPMDTGDFRLWSRRCLDALRSMHEHHRFLRGMAAWVGFPQTTVLYDRQPRAAGHTKYPLSRMVRLALDAVFSFSPTPLRLSLYGGVAVGCFGIGYGIYAVLRRLLIGDTVPGWTSSIVLFTVLGGAILISNGILGEYVGRIFIQVKERPLYIVAARFPDARAIVAPAAAKAPAPPSGECSGR